MNLIQTTAFGGIQDMVVDFRGTTVVKNVEQNMTRETISIRKANTQQSVWCYAGRQSSIGIRSSAHCSLLQLENT
jgi:hypothetical protein